MKCELGIACCGLACCLCAENAHCAGCRAAGCRGEAWCENRRCAMEKGLPGCYACAGEDCRKGLLQKSKPRGFTAFVRRYGTEALLDRLAANEQNGVVYHREGVVGDYDDFNDTEALIAFIRTGKR